MIPYPTMPFALRNYVVWLSQNNSRTDYTNMVWQMRDKEQDERNKYRRDRDRYVFAPQVSTTSVGSALS